MRKSDELYSMRIKYILIYIYKMNDVTRLLSKYYGSTKFKMCIFLDFLCIISYHLLTFLYISLYLLVLYRSGALSVYLYNVRMLCMYVVNIQYKYIIILYFFGLYYIGGRFLR